MQPLKQEGITYLAGGAELPCVIINVHESGSWLGDSTFLKRIIIKSQGGGETATIMFFAYAPPENLQETVNIIKAIILIKLDYYRNPVTVTWMDLIGQMMESVDLDSDIELKMIRKPWAASGKKWW